MKGLALFVLALVLLIPSPASARPVGYIVLNSTCEEDADQPGICDIRATTDMTNEKDDPDTVRRRESHAAESGLRRVPRLRRRQVDPLPVRT